MTEEELAAKCEWPNCTRSGQLLIEDHKGSIKRVCNEHRNAMTDEELIAWMRHQRKEMMKDAFWYFAVPGMIYVPVGFGIMIWMLLR